MENSIEKFNFPLEVLLSTKTLNINESSLKESIWKWLLENLKIFSFLKNAQLNNGFYIIKNGFPSNFVEQISQMVLYNNYPDLLVEPELIPKYMLKCNVSDIKLEIGYEKTDVPWKYFQFDFNLYQAFNDFSQNNLEDDSPGTIHTFLPSIHFIGLWESLYFEDDLKERLLNYILTSVLFGKKNINCNLINWNKLLLLHGPPGTGKTSLCKALCQKLSIKLRKQYERFELIEINSHSLFSKWFSESGKLVVKLFDHIRESAEDESSMIFVLIDEVESLVYDRQKANSSDPSDAIRVVNALLTQLDSIKHYPNILMLANSNITTAMDNAFVDRADIKQFIGYPSPKAIFFILYSAIKELIENNLITLSEGEKFEPGLNLDQDEKLMSIIKKCKNLTGRTLRKLPFLAYSLYCCGSHTESEIIKLDQFIMALDKTVDKQLEDNQHFI